VEFVGTDLSLGFFDFVQLIIIPPLITCALHARQATGMAKNSTCDIQGGTALASFRNTVNAKTHIAVARKSQQFPRISAHLLMAD
jgi:hypothetical protein